MGSVASPAWAACSNPAGAASQTRYDFTANTLHYCNDTTWITMGGGALPAGAVMAFDATTCPAGWSEYAAARGRFLRGLDNGAGNDPGGTRAPGNTQADAFQAHTHTGDFASKTGSGSPTGSNLGPSALYLQSAVQSGYGTDGANGTPRTSSETRPKNVAVLFCRKD